MKPGWRSLSFMDNFAAGIEALGYRGAGVAWGLASIDWDSKDDRDAALLSIASASGNERVE